MSFYEILSLTVALSMLFFGACIFIYKLFTLSFKEIKQMLKKPTFIFTMISIVFIVTSYFIKNFFYDLFFIPLVIGVGVGA
jgi:intracellular septation protein A